MKENKYKVGIMDSKTNKLTVKDVAVISVHPKFVALSFYDESGVFDTEYIDTKKFYVTTIG